MEKSIQNWAVHVRAFTGYQQMADDQKQFLVFLEDFNKIYNSMKGMFHNTIFWIFMAIFGQNFSHFQKMGHFWEKNGHKIPKN